MMCACLIPVTRKDLAQTAVEHAEADGWTVFQEHDSERIGVNPMRNALLKTALDAGADYIRWADDDDIIMPHREAAVAALQDTDVAYFDFYYSRYGQTAPYRFSGDIKSDAMDLPAPWAFVARADALRRFTDCNPLWDLASVYGHGGEAFFKMMQSGLRIRHVPVFAYDWRYAICFPHITQGPRRDQNEEMRLLRERIPRWFKEGGSCR